MNTQCSVFSSAQTRTHTHTLPYAHTSTQLTHVYTPSLSNLLPFSSSFLIQIIPPPPIPAFSRMRLYSRYTPNAKGRTLSFTFTHFIHQSVSRGKFHYFFPQSNLTPPKKSFYIFPIFFSLPFSFVLSFSISFTHLYSII